MTSSSRTWNMDATANTRNDGNVWIGIDFGTTHCSVAAWDASRGSPKWMRLARHGLAAGNHKVGRLVPSQLLLRSVHQTTATTTTTTASDKDNQDDDTWQNVSDLVVSLSITTSSLRSPRWLQAAMGAAAARLVDQAWEQGTSMSIVAPSSQHSAAAVSDALVTSLKRHFAAATSSDRNSSKKQDGERKFVSVTPLPDHDDDQDDDDAKQSQMITPTDLVAAFLRALREAADDYLQKYAVRKELHVPCHRPSNNATSTVPLRCTNVVVGVPAHYSHPQRLGMVQAAQRAGFTGHVSTITESTAAAMAYYGLFYNKAVAASANRNDDDTATNNNGRSSSSSILVFDMGGGTTDVTIAEFHAVPAAVAASTDDSPQQSSPADQGDSSDPSRRFRVVVTEGDGRLGGDDMDQALLTTVLRKISLDETQLPLHQRRSLLLKCQRAKEELCSRDEHDTSAAVVTVQGKRVEITRNDLDTAIEPLLQRAKALVTTALEQHHHHHDDGGADTPRHKMDEIILIGGATRVPAVRSMLSDLFPHQELCVSVNAMSAVAQGAAIQAAILSQHVPLHELESALMIDSSPHAIGVLVQLSDSQQRFVEILPKGSSLPAMGYATFQLADPDQAGVTVVAVEEIRSSSISPSSATQNCFYAPLGEFTFLLHRLNESERNALLNGTRSVDIGMTLQEDGAFVVSIFDERDPEHVRKKERYQRAKQQLDSRSTQDPRVSFKSTDSFTTSSAPQDSLSMEQILLLIGCFVLFGLYVFAKMAFQEEMEQSLVG